MENLTCKTCGCDSMRPMRVVFDDNGDEPHPDDPILNDAMNDSDILDEQQESRFYSCQVCGDNWLTVKEKTADGDCTITFVHQMGTSPVLKRVAHMTNAVLMDEDNVDHWEYYKGEEPVPEDEWEDTLEHRRDTLKATAVN